MKLHTMVVQGCTCRHGAHCLGRSVCAGKQTVTMPGRLLIRTCEFTHVFHFPILFPLFPHFFHIFSYFCSCLRVVPVDASQTRMVSAQQPVWGERCYASHTVWLLRQGNSDAYCHNTCYDSIAAAAAGPTSPQAPACCMPQA